CFYVLFLIHRQEDLLGPDALRIDPDRFLDERLCKCLVPNSFILHSTQDRGFFAYNEASYFLIKLHKFEDSLLALDKPEPSTTKGRDKVTLSSKVTPAVKDGL
ncbi:hypothetical protein K435DRAFT_781716, partial [Dendrothele bispora CBS 962.96]